MDMDDYNDIRTILKPRREFMASDELKSRITASLDAHTRKKSWAGWAVGIGASCAAAAILLVLLVPTGMSAKEILREVFDTLRNTGNIEMTIEVRTRPMENFKYINLSDEFISHNVSIIKSDSILTWRIDKGERTAIGNDSAIYTWIERLKIGWKTDTSNPEDLLGYMAIFLTPEKIIESELQNSLNNSETDYRLFQKDGDIILSVNAAPQGVFNNPYMLNASIAESESIRRYVIDADTKQLKSASVSIIRNNRETEVLKISDITYGGAKSTIMALPPGIRFIDMPQTALPGLAGLNATEAASAFLNALEKWDSTILDNVIDNHLQSSIFEQDLKGAQLISVGKSFNSGNEGTTFVPYILRLSDGSEKRHNLALQRSQQGGWIVVGGL